MNSCPFVSRRPITRTPWQRRTWSRGVPATKACCPRTNLRNRRQDEPSIPGERRSAAGTTGESLSLRRDQHALRRSLGMGERGGARSSRSRRRRCPRRRATSGADASRGGSSEGSAVLRARGPVSRSPHGTRVKQPLPPYLLPVRCDALRRGTTRRAITLAAQIDRSERHSPESVERGPSAQRGSVAASRRHSERRRRRWPSCRSVRLTICDAGSGADLRGHHAR
jgi:hypothetical protein